MLELLRDFLLDGSWGGDDPSCCSIPVEVMRHSCVRETSLRANLTRVPSGTSRTSCWHSTSVGSKVTSLPSALLLPQALSVSEAS